MKRNTECPKCGSARVGYFETLVDFQHGVKDETRALAQLQQGGAWQGPEHVKAEVEAYVCTECGYFEEYVKQPGLVPWEKFETFHWANR